MLRRFKDAVKFNFTVSPDDVTLECLNKWEPHLLAVTCTRRSKKRSTKPMPWERSTENPAKLEVRWSIPENLEMMVTFYRDTDKTHFDDKEWNFILEEIDGSRRKPLASEVINLAQLAAVSQAEQKSLTLRLRPISSKIASAELALTLSWVFVKAGNSKDDDMQSVASFDAISNCSLDEPGQLKRNHHGGSDAGPFERNTPGRSTTSFETGRRFANFFKSHRNKEKSPGKFGGQGKISDGTRTLPLPIGRHGSASKSSQVQPIASQVTPPPAAGSHLPESNSSEGTVVTSISVTASVHSDLGTTVDSPVHLPTGGGDSSSSPKEPTTVIKRSALPSDFLKNLAERQKEMANKKARPVYEGTPPSSPEVDRKEIVAELLPPPPSEIDPPPSSLSGEMLSGASTTPLQVKIESKNVIREGDEAAPGAGADQSSLLDQSTNSNSEGANNNNENQAPSENLQGLDLLDWCKQVTSGYPGVYVTNLTTSWRNGLAFAATIHHFRSDLIDWDELIQAQSQSQLVYRRVLDAVLQLNVTSLPWEHGTAIDLNAVPDRLLVTRFLYELRQKLSNPEGQDVPEIEPPLEPSELLPVPRSNSNDFEPESRNNNNRLSPSSSLNSTDRVRVVSPVLGSAPKPAPGTPLMTRQQLLNPLDSDEEEDPAVLNLFLGNKPPHRTSANPGNSNNTQSAQQVSPARTGSSTTPTIQRAASSPKTKIRVIKPGNSSNSASQGVLTEGGSVSSSTDSCGSSLTLPKVVEMPSAEASAGSPVRMHPASPKPTKATSSGAAMTMMMMGSGASNSDSNLVAKQRSPGKGAEDEKVRKNSSSSIGSASRLRDVLISRPILTFPDEIDHVPLPPPEVEIIPSEKEKQPSTTNGHVNGHEKQELSNGGGGENNTANKVLRSGVSMLVDVEPGEQELLARQQTAIEKETADIQNLLQRMALTGDRELEPTLLQRLFVLVNRKDAVVRRKFQVDLVEKERQLMQQRDEIEQQLRQLLAKEDRTEREVALEADLMNRLRGVVLERESVVEQLDLQTAEIEHDEEMSSMNRIVVRSGFNSSEAATSPRQTSEYRTNSNESSRNHLQQPGSGPPTVTSTSQSLVNAASPRIGRFFAQRASAFRGWLSGGST